MCQIASSVDRWIRHLRVSKKNPYPGPPEFQRFWWRQAYMVGIICPPWLELLRQNMVKTSPHVLICSGGSVYHKRASLWQRQTRGFVSVAWGPFCVTYLHTAYTIAFCNEIEIAKKYKNQRTRRNTQKSFVCFFILFFYIDFLDFFCHFYLLLACLF